MRIVGAIPIGWLGAALLCAAAAGQGLPATSPTAVSPVGPPVAQVAKKPADLPAHRAEVTYRTGILSVAAENSSLNQILREIGQLTGMKITGGVNDERVYGSYGPADTETVLTALLKGTGSNIMLVLDDRQLPKELVLTPRQGGPTPPNPNAAREREEEDLPPMRMPRVRGVEGVNTPPQFHPPQALPAEVAPQPPAVQQPAPQPPAAGDTTQQSPNGVKTPQEIYDQLMKLQQQQQQKPANPTPPQ
jgi:hypothetical protein